jgi:hypothetical protein
MTCPECDRGACLFCWNEPFARCESCIQRDPARLAPPIPWEDPEGGPVLRRMIDTLVLAVRPIITAPSFARPAMGPAVRFALCTALPLALLRGVIPYTHTLRFGDTFGVATLGSPSTSLIVLDVMRAMGMSLLLVTAAWVALALPYVHLSRAYGTPLAGAAALRVLLYRAWLLAVGGLAVGPNGAGYGLLFGVAAWALPAEPANSVVLLVLLIDGVVPLLLLLFAMRATARFGAGTGAFASFALTVLPFVLLFAVGGALLSLMEPWMPQGPAVDTPP